MTQEGFLARIGNASARLVEKLMPDAWIYAVLLTAIAFVAAVIWTPSTPWGAFLAWQGEFWNRDVLVLIAQFSINLILCTTLARAPLVQRGLIRLARLPRSEAGAIWLISMVSIALSLVSWALCIVAGALFAQEVCRQAKLKRLHLHYPLAIAAGYLGMMTWGCGFTSSAPLMSATPGHFMEKLIGIVPISATIGSATSLVILLSLVVACPWLMAKLHPAPKSAVEFAPPEEPVVEAPTGKKSFGDRLETSQVLIKLAALPVVLFVVNHYFIQKKGLTLDSMNLVFLAAVLLLYRSPREMLFELSRSSEAVWGIVFQFPFYAGLMGLLKGTGLGLLMASFFAEISTPATWPTIGLLSQTFLNLFIPSGGTQWLVTSELLVETGRRLGFSDAHSILIEVMGDQLANMVTPMWALPALALARLRARDILGYTAVVMALGAVIMALGLTLIRP